MNETVFSYKPQFKLSSIGAGIVLPVFFVLLPLIYPFSITFGGFTIVPYPWTIALCCLIALCFLWTFFNQIRHYNKLKRHDCTIQITDGTVKYKDVVKGTATDRCFRIADVTKVKVDNEDDELIITVQENDGKVSDYTLQTKYFLSPQEMDNFINLLPQ